MRNSLVESLLKYKNNQDFCFITGDLGFAALEPLEKELGDRFINAGVAEQNMISVAAGLAKSGMKPWIYSISPFIYARPFEQVRNDICLHDLPVCLIGSGAGYGYGINGPSHHALEDCATMSSLQNMTVFVPTFASDMGKIVSLMMESHHPSYLRLGRDEAPSDFIGEGFCGYRKLLNGTEGIILGLGGISGSLLGVCQNMGNGGKFSLWTCGKLPVFFDDIPSELLNEVENKDFLLVVEDHVSTGGLGEQFLACVAKNGIFPRRFYHRCANGYPSEFYGSQDFYREQSGIGVRSIKEFLSKIIVRGVMLCS